MQRVQIVTCDPATRRIEGRLKDGVIIQIAVWEIPSGFRWPKTDEFWTVIQRNHFWHLGQPMEIGENEKPIEDLQPGDTKIGGGSETEIIIDGTLKRPDGSDYVDIPSMYGQGAIEDIPELDSVPLGYLYRVTSGTEAGQEYRNTGDPDWTPITMTLKVLSLESDSTSVQNLTNSFVTMKQSDGTTDSSVTPESGKKYEVFVAYVCSKATHAPSMRICDFEVRAGATVVGKSVAAAESSGSASPPEAGTSDSGTVYLGAIATTRATASAGIFTSDGTPIKLYIKADSTTDTPRVERNGTYVLLKEISS